MIEQANQADIQHFCEVVGYKPSIDIKGLKCEVDGELQGIVCYDRWTENAVQMHVWIPKPKCLSGRIFLHEIFRYPFEIANRGLAIAVTAAHNTASLKFQKFLGFEEKYRIQDGWAIGDDMIIAELKRSNCVWLRPLPHDVRTAAVASGTAH